MYKTLFLPINPRRIVGKQESESVRHRLICSQKVRNIIFLRYLSRAAVIESGVVTKNAYALERPTGNRALLRIVRQSPSKLRRRQNDALRQRAQRSQCLYFAIAEVIKLLHVHVPVEKQE